jgi:phage terminase small subunit
VRADPEAPGKLRKRPKELHRDFTVKERRFMQRYLVTFSAARAAKEAGFGSKNAGLRLLEKPKIAAELFRRQDAHLKTSDLSAERTLEEIRRVAMSDLTDLYDDEGHLLNLKDLPPHIRATIAGVKMKDGEIIEVKLWPKLHALDLAARHLRLLVELSEQKTSLEIRIREMTQEQRRELATDILQKARRFLNPTIIEQEAPESGGIGADMAED